MTHEPNHHVLDKQPVDFIQKGLWLSFTCGLIFIIAAVIDFFLNGHLDHAFMSFGLSYTMIALILAIQSWWKLVQRDKKESINELTLSGS